MLADYEEIAGYLLGRELISAERIVANDLTIVDASRRHANFEVVSDDGPCYFLKQDVAVRGNDGDRHPASSPSTGDPALGTIAHEARMYRLFANARRARAFRRYLPRCHGFDPAEGLLILEAVPGSKSLAAYHYPRGRFSSLVARELGRALGTLHGAFGAGGEDAEGFERLPNNLPWVLGLPRPTRWFHLNSSSGNLEFLRIAQATEDLADLFDDLERRWNADTIIHGDLKWTNALWVTDTASDSTTRRGPRIRLVDWELAGRGDACWDVGSLFSEYLNLWLSSIPISGAEPPDRFLDLARFPLPRMQPSIRSFWGAYARHARLEAPEAARRLVLSIRYAAARLVQSAYEQLQDQATVTNGAIFRLQLCHNMLTRPTEAAVQLLGLPLAETADHV